MIFIFWINTPSNSPLSKWLIAKNLPRKLYDLVANPSPTIVMLISNIIFFPILMNKNSFEISMQSFPHFRLYGIQEYTVKSDCLAGNSHSFKRSLYLIPFMKWE